MAQAWDWTERTLFQIDSLALNHSYPRAEVRSKGGSQSFVLKAEPGLALSVRKFQPVFTVTRTRYSQRWKPK